MPLGLMVSLLGWSLTQTMPNWPTKPSQQTTSRTLKSLLVLQLKRKLSIPSPLQTRAYICCSLPQLGPKEPYDIVFIDADKTGYPGYLKQLLSGSQPGSANRLLRPGALIITDNVLRRGLVADNAALSADGVSQSSKDAVLAVREFNDLVISNSRLETFLVPLWDGLNLTRLID